MWLTLILSAAILRSAFGSATAPSAESSTIQPDPIIQEHLAKLAETKRHTIERSAELIELWKISRQPEVRRDRVLLQAALYDATHRHVSTLEPIMIEFQVDSGQIAHVLLPYHDTPDRHLHDLVWNLISCSIDQSTEMAGRDSRVREMLDYLGRTQVDPPSDLVRQVFYGAPTAAIDRLSMQWLMNDPAQEQKRRAILWTSHLVEDVVWKHNNRFLKHGEDDAAEAELDKLSKSPEWWVRLYVAHMLRRHDDVLDAPKARERLKKDSNPLVVEAINDKVERGPPETER